MLDESIFFAPKPAFFGATLRPPPIPPEVVRTGCPALTGVALPAVHSSSSGLEVGLGVLAVPLEVRAGVVVAEPLVVRAGGGATPLALATLPINMSSPSPCGEPGVAFGLEGAPPSRRASSSFCGALASSDCKSCLYEAVTGELYLAGIFASFPARCPPPCC